MTIITAAVGPTTISKTAGTETAIGTSYQIPQGFNCIKSIKVWVATPGAFTAAEPLWGVVRIYSKDVKVEPCAILAEPIGSALTSGFATPLDASYEWPLNLPVSGGNIIYFYGQILVSATVAPVMGITLKLTTEGPAGPQFFYEKGTITATGTAAATVSGTAYRVSNIKRVTGLFAAASITTAAAAKCEIASVEFASTDWKVAFNPSLAMEPQNAILSAGVMTNRLSKELGLDIPCNDPITITDKITFHTAPDAGYWITGIQFVNA